MTYSQLAHWTTATRLPYFFAAAILFRVATLAISKSHEKALKKDGAVEYGANNSHWLTLAHLSFYLSVITEGYLRKAAVDGISALGFALYAMGVIMLLTVMHLLGRLWTVKLLIARDHALVQHPLFRLVRHPNYFLSIVPELTGLALVFHASATLIAGSVLYSLPLALRIREEERVMKAKFSAYI
nr:isoprenylcysteine carboxylmethyltransferase family protein [Granulicella aggregans]